MRNIYINGERVSSSYFTSRTKTIFRSASAKYYVFIQVCRETYEFDEDGERYYEKAMVSFSLHIFPPLDNGLKNSFSLPLCNPGRFPPRAL